VHPELRAVVASWIASIINWKKPPTSLKGVRPSIDCSAIVASIKTNGWSFLPPISPEQVDDIKQYLAGKPGFVAGKYTPLDRLPSECTGANYPLDTVLKSPHFFEIANAPANLEIARQYFGCVPTISQVAIRWSLPGDGEDAIMQKFHRDPDD